MRARSPLVLLLVVAGLLGWGPRVFIEICRDPGACERAADPAAGRAHADRCCASDAPAAPRAPEPELCGCCVAVPTGLAAQLGSPDDGPPAIALAAGPLIASPPAARPAARSIARPQLSHPPPQRVLPLLS